ncbi:MAG: tRNA epoxyqueuosine(34) reductase QueG [SAR324 cluster bacterium]|nr:tRNA epoxyqueuosine(34) reductase QueG [SAR324 cluster bacterium]
MENHLITLLKSVGAVQVGFLNRRDAQFGPWIEPWINNMYHGDMEWMSKNAPIRSDPCSILDGGKSIVSIAFPYYTQTPEQWRDQHLISNYAWGEDYHLVIKRRLKEAIQLITEAIPGFKGRGFTDSAPLPEKIIAAACGIGWIGKNSLLISPEWGSYLFLAEIVCNLDLVSTPPLPDKCGKCELCVKSCPNRAIVDDKSVNATNCASYLTIEKKGDFNTTEQKQIHYHLFGCDSCQLVCPWNKKLRPLENSPFACDQKWLHLKPVELLTLTEVQFEQLKIKSPLKRLKLAGIHRNACAILNNRPSTG